MPVPATCPTAIRRLIVRAAGGGVGVATQRSDGLLQCTFAASRPSRMACSKALIIIDTQPQAFKAFDRWAVEAGQNAMWTHEPSLNPTPVGGIGILAEWVPGSHTFETSTATTWVAIFLTCRAHSAAGLPLAKSIARAALSATAAAKH